jgi:hypothetical protein
MGRASKNRGPIGHNHGQVQYLPDSPGERKAPCSLAPWQLPPKVSPAGDVPTRTTHQRKHSSRRLTVATAESFQKPREPDGRTGQAHQADHAVPLVVRCGHGP